MWIKSLTIIDAPFFNPDTQFNFARANILYGDNGTGKSLAIELLYCALSGQCIPRFKSETIIFEVSLSNPVFDKVKCKIENNTVLYEIDGKHLSFSPFNLDVIFLHNYKKHQLKVGDDIDCFQRYLYLDREQIKNIISAVDISNGFFVKQIDLKIRRSRPYEKIDLKVKFRDQTEHIVPFAQLSQSEQLSIILDLIINHVKMVSQYRNVIMLVDNCEIDLYSEDGKNHYIELLQNNSIHFQSIITAIRDDGFSALPGWNILKLHKPKK